MAKSMKATKLGCMIQRSPRVTSDQRWQMVGESRPMILEFRRKSDMKESATLSAAGHQEP